MTQPFFVCPLPGLASVAARNVYPVYQLINNDWPRGCWRSISRSLAIERPVGGDILLGRWRLSPRSGGIYPRLSCFMEYERGIMISSLDGKSEEGEEAFSRKWARGEASLVWSLENLLHFFVDENVFL